MQTKTKKNLAAITRKTDRSERTAKQQLAILAKRPGEAKRERARLAK